MRRAVIHPWSAVLKVETLLSLVFDALRLAAAESAGADVLLSIDDRLIKRAARGVGTPRIPVRNPVSWSKEQGV